MAIRYVIKTYDYFSDPIDTKGTFLAVRYNDLSAVRCCEEFKSRWGFPYVLLVEEESVFRFGEVR